MPSENMTWGLIFCLGIAVSLLPTPAFSWSDTGHRVTCELAFEQLQPSSQVALRRLMTAMPADHAETFLARTEPTVTDLCVWADKVRKDRAYDRVVSWHYVNVDRNQSEVSWDRCVTGCILTAIDTHLALIRDRALSDWAKLQAVMFVAHWIGDIHQPMHVSFADDLGGNRTRVKGYEDCNNLHGVWDYCLVKESGLSYLELVNQLRGKVEVDTRPIASVGFDPSEALAWANESLAIARHPRTQYCKVDGGVCRPWASRQYQLDPDYQSLNWPIAAERLKLASGRMARLLDWALSTGPE